MTTAKFITDAIEKVVKYKSNISDDILEKLLAEIEAELFDRDIKRRPDLYRKDDDWINPESKL